MFSKFVSSALVVCFSLSDWFGSSVISAILFGEYPYPNKNQYDD